MIDYIASTKQLIDLNPQIALPAHGAPIINNPVAVLHRYIEHRQQREEAILKALQSGCRTVDEVVKTVYKGTFYQSATRF